MDERDSIDLPELVLPFVIPEEVKPSLKEFCDTYDPMLDQFIFIGDFS